jgi:putative membrane protein
MSWPAWRRDGRDPDYRFTLANERTFLAWVRTAMAVLAGGVVLAQFADRLRPHGVLVSLSVALSILSGALCVMAYRHWRGNEIAMRQGQALPAPLAVPLIGGGMLLASVAIAGLMLWN